MSRSRLILKSSAIGGSLGAAIGSIVGTVGWGIWTASEVKHGTNKIPNESMIGYAAVTGFTLGAFAGAIYGAYKSIVANPDIQAALLDEPEVVVQSVPKQPTRTSTAGRLSFFGSKPASSTLNTAESDQQITLTHNKTSYLSC